MFTIPITLTTSILTLLLLTPLSLSLTIPSNADLLVHNPELNMTNPSLKFACLPRPQSGQAVQPQMSNCAGALRALDTDSEEGVFHNGGEGDGYQLPQFERYKDCEVLVETVAPGDDPVSSWAEIGLAALELNMACLGAASSNYFGGVTFCGGGDMVKISLRGTTGKSVENTNAGAAETA